ncbi:glycoside hydrolase family 130 protein [Hymenobacter cheonanensis]|uniref:glycoside hydrolase family 130 protein n=1 Tax=Hymenobacter sp. CA2-7 TaxID=3063993 RepID=UPI0027142D1F|nr:glycoside hydrolase family 130 protein [Hymenobacter sp. CA2-7]MDO7885410.1 glycoside hydrolase family 130 protein [Hymenobacter sp. CA2-7]
MMLVAFRSHKLTGSALVALATLAGCSQPHDSAATTAADWRLLGFTKADSVNPIMGPQAAGVFQDPILQRPVWWEEKDVYNPAMVVRGDTLYMLYRAENRPGASGKVSRIGLASSADGVHFRRRPQPVLYPGNDAQKKYEWPGGVEDPRVVEGPGQRYYMTYTAYDGTLARLQVASSPDLVHWTKHGSAFSQAYGGKYVNKWSKSGAIVSRYGADGRIVAAKIKGKYWMYWGDAQIWLATSNDLIHWTPLEMAAGGKPPVTLRDQALTMPNLLVVLPTRTGKFDSNLVEPGPPAMLTPQGIRLIYNSRNVPLYGDNTLPEGTYSAAQALFDKDDPTKLVQRMDTYFIRPERPYELTGQVNQVVFLEGLAQFRGKWLLYYGTADSKIAVATRAVAP